MTLGVTGTTSQRQEHPDRKKNRSLWMDKEIEESFSLRRADPRLSLTTNPTSSG